jgi:hypothetical protein
MASAVLLHRTGQAKKKPAGTEVRAGSSRTESRRAAYFSFTSL